MHRQGPLLSLIAGILWLIAVFPLSAQSSSSPLQVVQSGSDRGLGIIKSSLFEGGPSLRQRREEILSIVEEYFDFQEMSKRALGRPWKELSLEQQQEFVRLFKQLLFNSYVSRIKAVTTPTTSTRCTGEMLEEHFALVKTQITGVGQSDFVVNYKLRLSGEGWKVYDVVIEEISLIDNYRQQFNSILNSHSFESLLERLREKVERQSASL